MKVLINGNEEVIDNNSITITQLLQLKNIKMPEMVSVELNGNILSRDEFDSTFLKDGDSVEFLYFMGGGNGYMGF